MDTKKEEFHVPCQNMWIFKVVSRNNHNIDRHNQQFYKQTFTKAAFFFLRTLSSSRASSNVEVTFKTTKKNKKTDACSLLFWLFWKLFSVLNPFAATALLRSGALSATAFKKYLVLFAACVNIYTLRTRKCWPSV